MPSPDTFTLPLSLQSRTFNDMAKHQGRPPSGKTMVQCRIDPGNLAKLDELAKAMRPIKPSRSQMIDVAVAEYVERHGKPSKR